MSSSYTFKRLVAEYEQHLAQAKRGGTPSQVRKAEAKLRSARRRLERAQAKEQEARNRPPKVRKAAGRGLGRTGKPLKRTCPLRGSGKPLKATKPMAKVNKVRAPKMRELRFSVADGYHAYIKGQPCIRCGAPPPVDPMHVLGVDLGGTAEHLLPGCRKCHTWQEVNKKAFEAEFVERNGITALEMARAMRVAYKLEQGEQT